ncbi:hypothetical protein SDC9_69200 [bioreactor metagenome]|uniref:Uncharacterized protein n=1 Tax=bioreactor metagenome TaxID=1076179 RepID=A0A644Y2H4_9ZZZZ
MQMRKRRASAVSHLCNQIAFSDGVSFFYGHTLLFQMTEFGIKIGRMSDDYCVAPVLRLIYFSDRIVWYIHYNFLNNSFSRSINRFAEAIVVLEQCSRTMKYHVLFIGNLKVPCVAVCISMGFASVVALSDFPGTRDRDRNRQHKFAEPIFIVVMSVQIVFRRIGLYHCRLYPPEMTHSEHKHIQHGNDNNIEWQ